MPRIPLFAGLLMFALATLACSTTKDTQPAAHEFVLPTNETFPAFTTWTDIMEKVIGPSFDEVLIVEASKPPEDMNLNKIAATTERAARYMALGHGIHEDSAIASFGSIAKDCEQWLLEIEANAKRGDSKTVQGLILRGEKQHCDRCHEAERP